ncbi:MAG: hypothetical protein LBS35_02465 [Synergistaceae bacterium]|jgi:hypothetical protein|nr:hypothetical protein [Synergistaceae bacterium]
MRHRNIDDTKYSLAAIDSVIERGQRRDWALLQLEMKRSPDLCRKVFDIASHNLEHPYTIRYHYWYHLAKERLKG